MKARVIVNPQANKGNCLRRWPEIKAELEKNMGSLSPADVAMTSAPNHASELARQAVSSGCERIVSVGGDGTLNEVLNGLIVDNRPIAPDIVLAQVPGGTSNELARSFGHLPLADACRAAVSTRVRPMDVFRVEARAHSGQAAMRYGFVLAIAGAAATISWRAQRVPFLKRLGPLSYVIMTIVTTFTYLPRSYRIAFDDEAATSQKLWSVLACSFDGAGEGLALAPGADSADGHFDVITVGDVGRWEALTQIALRLADGSYLSNPKTTRRKASRLTIDADHFVLADVDGENLGKLPMRIEMLPFRISVAVL